MLKRSFVPVTIPTNQSFLTQWHPWVQGQVNRHFKRDKERSVDVAQDVRLRLLAKDFIARWFFKHLTGELVDRPSAERILGGMQVMFIGALHPASEQDWSCAAKKLARLGYSSAQADDVYAHVAAGGKVKDAPHLAQEHRDKLRADQCVRNFASGSGCPRSCENSLWLVDDLLRFARFDHERYYYSIQKHTIDSNKVLRLLGYGKFGADGAWSCDDKDYGILESLYRQGRLKPSELTEHRCVERTIARTPVNGLCTTDGCTRPHYSRGFCSSCYRKARVERCAECDRGRESLKERGLSLTHRWTSPDSAAAAAKLRWNDDQLRPFLRAWRRTNMVSTTPLYIMRRSAKPGIDAGLLKYAKIIIDNEVVNSFKRMARADDLAIGTFNNGVSGEFSNDETVAWEGEQDSDEGMVRVLRDVSSTRAFNEVEGRLDVESLAGAAGLAEDEVRTVSELDALEVPMREVCERDDVPSQRVQKIRAAALKKLRDRDLGTSRVDRVLDEVSAAYGIARAEVLGPASFGRPVLARAEVCARLSDAGMQPDAIASALGISVERVVSGINRAAIRGSRANAAE